MKILVILASYNGEEYIIEQIQSILSQKNVDVSISVFDDMSNDSTVEILKKKFGDLIDIKVNKKASGSAANNFLNAILGLSNKLVDEFDYFAFADQDDIWLNNKLERAVEKLKFEKSSLYCSNLDLWDEENNYNSIIRKDYPQKKYDFLFEGGSAGCTYVFDKLFCIKLKDSLANINYLNWKFLSHDWLVYFIARINNYKVFIDRECTIKYRIHSQNVHGQMNKFTIKAIVARLKILDEGWYSIQSARFINLTERNSIQEKIYYNFNHNYFSRIKILLQFNFQLMRSKKKFLQFFVLNLFIFNKTCIKKQ
ncbi:glycosyltransferase [Flavobacterium psychrophilum]|uniref:glycosyltransferase n=1 Tax=Flavobacterium psychrophilum TaxID=96345 RepID=UPI000B7C4EEA|nr:glycosyltransferase [Flavobacterium psychrophilum]EKT4525827.1 glycosyltransferase [Flavobacterium psychrophilum]ELY1992852.1 glycosyltransferase [Flavobacterium psychrophilum]SNA68313.1 probable glycosyltransferase, group 2 family protein [Flavobacterium psychrophilum]